MSDLIDRAEAISRAVELRMYGKPVKMVAVKELERLPSVRAEERTNKRTETHACDCISRQAALHLITEYNGVMDKSVAKRLLMQMTSAKPEPTADAEFWRKRADYYSDMCSKLIADMGAGVKIEAVKIDETGIIFTKKKPSAQPETLGMICGACDDCDSTVLYLTNPPQVKCKRSGKLHFVTDHCDAPSAQPSGKDPIEREAVVDILHDEMQGCSESEEDLIGDIVSKVDLLPSAQAEIIRCNSCKYWIQTTGKMTGYGLGRCDFHNANLVACNGFCYWAERSTDGSD